MPDPEILVVAKEVELLQEALMEHKGQQAAAWDKNSRTHADLYGKLDRPPPWVVWSMTLMGTLVGTLAGVLGTVLAFLR